MTVCFPWIKKKFKKHLKLIEYFLTGCWPVALMRVALTYAARQNNPPRNVIIKFITYSKQLLLSPMNAYYTAHFGSAQRTRSVTMHYLLTNMLPYWNICIKQSKETEWDYVSIVLVGIRIFRGETEWRRGYAIHQHFKCLKLNLNINVYDV